MRRVAPASVLALALFAGLAACAPDQPRKERAEQDPAISGALNEQLMTDPDLARINPENRAVVGGGPATAPIPLEDRSPEAIARARADAAALLGRAAGSALPAATGNLAPARRDTPALAAFAALGSQAKPCADKLEYGFTWAARIPAALPIYPRGHAQDAGGTDRDGCALRSVRFVTPVPVAEVTAFYWAAARRAGLAAEHRMAGADHAVIARKGSATGVALIGQREDGLTQVDLVTSGL